MAADAIDCTVHDRLQHPGLPRYCNTLPLPARVLLHGIATHQTTSAYSQGDRP